MSLRGSHQESGGGSRLLRPGTSPGSYIAVDLMDDQPPPLPPLNATSGAGDGGIGVGGNDDGFGPASVAFLCTDASPAKKSSPALNSQRSDMTQQQRQQLQQHQLRQQPMHPQPSTLSGSAERLRHASTSSGASLQHQQQQQQQLLLHQRHNSSSSSPQRSQVSRGSLSEGRSNDGSPSAVKEINKRSNLIPTHAQRNFTGDYGKLVCVGV